MQEERRVRAEWHTSFNPRAIPAVPAGRAVFLCAALVSPVAH